MSSRIPVMFDRAIQPEWIDFALDQFLIAKTESELRNTLRTFLEGHFSGFETRRKIATQLQIMVGFRSKLCREELIRYHELLSALPPSERNSVRFCMVMQTTPFFARCVEVLRKLRDSGTSTVQIAHVYDRIQGEFGERGTIPRRVRSVMQTLAAFGYVEYVGGAWRIASGL